MTDERPRRPSLDPTRIRDAAPRWASVTVVDSAASTNAGLVAAVRAGDRPEHGTVLVAEHQTGGRGRLDRVWTTPDRAALTFSVLVRPGTDVAERTWPLLPLLAGVATAEGIRAAGGPAAELKWPNDVLVDGLKVAGILAERVEGSAGPVAVLGIGINVTTLRSELPVATATSLLLAGWPDPDRTGVLLAVLDSLGRRLEQWRSAPGAVLADYRSRCVTLGRRVRVQLPTGAALEGTAVGVDDGGGLVVETAGRTRTVTAGDVVHVRPAGPGGAGRRST